MSVDLALDLLQSSSCLRGDVCAILPCPCAETLAKRIRIEAIEECAAMLEDSCTFVYEEVIRDAAQQLRSLKDKP